MSTLTERMTADEYLALEDPRRTELIDGIVVVSEPAILHQHVCKLVAPHGGVGRRTSYSVAA